MRGRTGGAGQDRTTAALLACGVAAGPLFTVAYLVEGATRAGYDPLRHAVSTLQLGEFGWVQTANFIVAGLLTLAYAAGLRRALRPLRGSTWGPLLVGGHGIGLLGAGVFAGDPVSGYPPGTPGQVLPPSTQGALHDGFSVLTFVGLPVAIALLAWRFARWGRRGWALYSAVTAVVVVTGFVLSSLAFSQVEGLVAVGGLFQRATITAAWAWLTLLAAYLLRAARPGRDHRREAPP